MEKCGYVAVLAEPVTREQVLALVASWLVRMDRLEQVLPGANHEHVTTTIKAPEDLCWEKNLQFRVVVGEDFAWVYANLGGRAIETTGWPASQPDQVSLALDALLEFDGVVEIVDEKNARRLDELEAQGLL